MKNKKKIQEKKLILNKWKTNLGKAKTKNKKEKTKLGEV